MANEVAAPSAQGPALTPSVDIVEDGSGITVYADLPGVDRKDLSIDVEGRTLKIEGSVGLGEANSLVALYTEVSANRYRRSFELSSELDTTKIEASLDNGVLTLHLPRLEQAKPRRVEVKIG